ncbi:MAG: hypothetical protein R3F11_14085 [Verrucomicrobiales bacterium]
MSASTHYVLAHVLLRQLAFALPPQLFAALASDERAVFFGDLIEDAERLLANEENAETGNLAPESLKVTFGSIDQRPIAVIEFPPPANPAEAYYVGVLVDRTFPDGQLRIPELEGAPVRYVTLEKTVDHPESPPSMLCSWTAEGAHVNHGSGGEPTWDSFIEGLRRLSRKKVG